MRRWHGSAGSRVRTTPNVVQNTEHAERAWPGSKTALALRRSCYSGATKMGKAWAHASPGLWGEKAYGADGSARGRDGPDDRILCRRDDGRGPHGADPLARAGPGRLRLFLRRHRFHDLRRAGPRP